jgi:antitoxin (DNA-binding transcriptional repressor) of toxin-antitoxin stability system
METVNVATLKERLSHYLALVKNGREIIVTSHRHQVAKISPVSSPTAKVIEPVRPVKDLKKLKGTHTRNGTSVVEALLNDRHRR